MRTHVFMLVSAKGLITDADAPNDENNICFGKLRPALGQNINILSSVFVDQLGLVVFHGRINMKTDTALPLPL